MKSGDTAEILLFNGTGSSPNDVKAFETILKDQHVNYTNVNSSQLNGMSESQMRGYRLLLVPGGNFIEIGNGLTPVATAIEEYRFEAREPAGVRLRGSGDEV